MRINLPVFRSRFSLLSGSRKPSDSELFDNLLKSLTRKSNEKFKMETKDKL
jgi:hypothetical protein